MPRNTGIEHNRLRALRSKMEMAKFLALAHYCCILIGVFVAQGCQRGSQWDLTSVSGAVSQAGRPLPGATVVFLMDVSAGGNGPRTSAVTDADGRYELKTDAGDRGAAVGKYRVCVRIPRSAGMRIPKEYRSFAKTPLRAEVHSGNPETFDFDIPAGQGGRGARQGNLPPALGDRAGGEVIPADAFE